MNISTFNEEGKFIVKLICCPGPPHTIKKGFGVKEELLRAIALHHASGQECATLRTVPQTKDACTAQHACAAPGRAANKQKDSQDVLRGVVMPATLHEADQRGRAQFH